MLCIVTLLWANNLGGKTEYSMKQYSIDANNQHEALGIAMDKYKRIDGATLFMSSSLSIDNMIIQDQTDASGSDTEELKQLDTK